MSARFVLGKLYITSGARNTLEPEEICAGLRRHGRGDWGDIEESDKRENDRALLSGDRLLSAYTDANSLRFWIITEADRSATTILLPAEY